MLMDTWQVSLDWEHQVNSLAKSLPGGTCGKGNYVWCLAIVTKFKALRAANRCGHGGVLKSSCIIWEGLLRLSYED